MHAGCSDAWIGDGFCDKACNVSSCNFDFPDCVNSTQPGGGSGSSGKPPRAEVVCTRGCPETWLGDKVCDQRCKVRYNKYTKTRLDIKGSSNDWLSAQVEECAFDAGDCGMSMLADSLPWTALTSVNSVSRAFHSPSADISALNDSLNTSTVSPPVAMTVPVGTKAVYFTLTRMLCLSEPYSPAGLCNVTSAANNFTFLAAEHTEGSPVNYAVVVSKQAALVSAAHHYCCCRHASL